MATITPTSVSGSAPVAVTETTLTGSDTFSYFKARSPVLVISNATGSPVSDINIDGDGATSVSVSGYGVIDLTGGYDVPEVADGASVALKLAGIEKYLTGTIALTGGTGCTAQLLEF